MLNMRQAEWRRESGRRAFRTARSDWCKQAWGFHPRDVARPRLSSSFIFCQRFFRIARLTFSHNRVKLPEGAASALTHLGYVHSRRVGRLKRICCRPARSGGDWRLCARRLRAAKPSGSRAQARCHFLLRLQRSGRWRRALRRPTINLPAVRLSFDRARLPCRCISVVDKGRDCFGDRDRPRPPGARTPLNRVRVFGVGPVKTWRVESRQSLQPSAVA
jgi:hypothetical protein